MEDRCLLAKHAMSLSKKAKHIEQIRVRARDGEEVALPHDGAAATRAPCLICLEEVSTLRGLACPEEHLICSACLQRYICSLAGSAKLRSSNGALNCLGAHQQAFCFGRSMVEPYLFGDGLRLYLETMETPETPETMETPETTGDGEIQCTPESIQPELHEALNLCCPSCEVFCDPDPDGCIAMKCRSCDVAFCWLCFQPCGQDAHPHCREVHGGYFPSRSDMNLWHRRLRWHQVDGVLQRSFEGSPPERKEALRKEALRLCERHLADGEIRLWPFPNKKPSVLGCVIGGSPHVRVAQHGEIDELRALLDESPELIDQANDRGMTALMAAAHGGHAAVVTMLLKRRADVTCRDDRGVSALEYAIREDRQEVVLAILEHAGHVVNAVGPRGTTALLVACECRREAIARALLDCGAKVDALKNRLNIESATMLAKIGTEKGIMLFGIKRDQKEADFANRGLGPADAILISSDLVTGGLTSIDLSGNQLCGVWTQASGQHGTYTAEGIAAIAEALRVNGSLTVANLLGNQLDAESAKMLTKVAKQKGISLCGIQRDQTTADFRHKDLKPPDAILLASDLSQAIVTGALTSLNLSKNQLCGVDCRLKWLLGHLHNRGHHCDC